MAMRSAPLQLNELAEWLRTPPSICRDWAASGLYCQFLSRSTSATLELIQVTRLNLVFIVFSGQVPIGALLKRAFTGLTTDPGVGSTIAWIRGSFASSIGAIGDSLVCKQNSYLIFPH
jgi:hypothetical protein